MRFKALLHLGVKEVPESYVKQGKDLTPEQWREFVIKDNVGFGEWDFEQLANEWDTEQLSDWGLDLPVWDETNVNLPSDEQKEPENFDGFIVVLKIKTETFPIVKERIENICIEYGIEIDIS